MTAFAMRHPAGSRQGGQFRARDLPVGELTFNLPETMAASIASQIAATLVSTTIINNHKKKKKDKDNKREVIVHRTYTSRVTKAIRNKK